MDWIPVSCCSSQTTSPAFIPHTRIPFACSEAAWPGGTGWAGLFGGFSSKVHSWAKWKANAEAFPHQADMPRAIITWQFSSQIFIWSSTARTPSPRYNSIAQHHSLAQTDSSNWANIQHMILRMGMTISTLDSGERAVAVCVTWEWRQPWHRGVVRLWGRLRSEPLHDPSRTALIALQERGKGASGCLKKPSRR